MCLHTARSLSTIHSDTLIGPSEVPRPPLAPIDTIHQQQPTFRTLSANTAHNNKLQSGFAKLINGANVHQNVSKIDGMIIGMGICPGLIKPGGRYLIKCSEAAGDDGIPFHSFFSVRDSRVQ